MPEPGLRASSAEIARELGTVGTVRYRIQRLIDQEVIKPITVVNPAAFGYNLAVDIFCEVDVEQQNQIIEAILGFPEVTYLAISTGDQDVTLQAIFKNSGEVHDLTHKIHHIPGMRRTHGPGSRIIKSISQWLPRKMPTS
jgi:Lrp/AsnC family transcriptional regulator for asnA, asnC and gidA